jgi:mitochondrial inner membrane protease subunit 1
MSIFSALRRPTALLKDKYAGHPLRVFTATLKGFFLVHLIWDHFYAYSPLLGPSMLPNFEVMGDTVIVDRWYRRGRGIKVGDVVTFDSVVHPGEKVMKRILGMEGDYVLSHTPESGSDAMIQVRITILIYLYPF